MLRQTELKNILKTLINESQVIDGKVLVSLQLVANIVAAHTKRNPILDVTFEGKW